MQDMSYLQIEKQQQQEVASYHRSEASQNPRAKTALPSWEKQSIAHIHQDVTDNGLHAAGCDYRSGHVAGILKQVQNDIMIQTF